MKKLLLLFLILSFSNFCKLYAGEIPQDSTETQCAFDSWKDSMLLDSEFTAFQKRLDYFIQKYKQQGLQIPELEKPMPQDMMIMSFDCDTCFSTQSLYLIPIVVHVFHLPSDSVSGMGSNISNAQVHNAIVELNKSFAAFGYTDTNAFNTGIQFYLAPVGPDSNGILRYSTTLSDHYLYEYDKLWTLVDSFYNPERFVNIFTTNKNINPQNPSSPTVYKGYATMPHKTDNAIVIQHGWMGNFDCDNNFNLSFRSRGKTLPHEIGHYLGLYHTFEQGCAEDTTGNCEANGDRCCDTPPQSGENFDCSSPSSKSCQGGIPTQPGNCMDYPPDHIACGFWFTRNQTERMHATLQLVRKGLINIDSINQWGVRHCGLAMDFKGKQNILCDPDTVTLYGLRYIDSVHYRWIVHNPNSTLIDESGWNMHQIKFHIANQDTFDVTLIMTQNGESDTMTRANYVMLRECIPVADTRARWYFGQYAGLLFTEDGVVPDLGSFNAQTLNVRESCLSLSDSSGNLLFYGGSRMSPDGFLYNASHQIIRNDLGNIAFVKSKGISAQSLLAVPHPVRTGAFYIFSNTAHQEAKVFPNSKMFWGGLYYSELYRDSTDQWVFDHTAVNVEVRNLEGVPVIAHQEDSAILIREYMTAIPKCDNNGYWLVVVADDHPQQGGTYPNNNKLLILSVDTNGITLHDTLSLPNLDKQTSIGVAKFSPDGSMLALLNYLLDFDRLQGKATIRYEFNDKLSFGLTFSSNSKFLYFTDWQLDESTIYQLQLDDPSKKVEIGKIALFNITQRSNYQLAPDGKIYITNYDENDASPFITVINNPDTAQGLSNFNLTGFEEWTVPLQLSNVGGGAMDGFPNFIDAKQYTKELTTISHNSTVAIPTISGRTPVVRSATNGISGTEIPQQA